MFTLANVHLSPTSRVARVWSLISLGLFWVSSFFNAIFAYSNSIPFISTNFIENPKPHQKQRPLHSLLQIRYMLMASSKGEDHTKLLAWNGLLCVGGMESFMDHIFLHCFFVLAFWCRLFWLVGIDWVSLERVEGMLIIYFSSFGGLPEGRTLLLHC